MKFLESQCKEHPIVKKISDFVCIRHDTKKKKKKSKSKSKSNDKNK
jgi:hypothetical protein